MNGFFVTMLVLSLTFGLLNGKMSAVSGAALAECTSAVELSLKLAGTLCLWSGLGAVAERAGLAAALRRVTAPALKHIFTDFDKSRRALEAVSMNVAANLMGLGNAATPLGLEAMRRLQEGNPRPAHATPDMVSFVVLNTASLQLLPTTVAVLRMEAGAPNPLDILPAVWLSSAVSVAVGLLAARALSGGRGL